MISIHEATYKKLKYVKHLLFKDSYNDTIEFLINFFVSSQQNNKNKKK